MADEQPLDLRALGEVDSPEVVREALRRFRRRLWTRYVWIGLAIVLGAVALLVGSRPSNLREEMEAANVRVFPQSPVWYASDLTFALAEVADLGDSFGLHFVVLRDPETSSWLWVNGATYSMGFGEYDQYVEVPKGTDGTIVVIVGRSGCLPRCAKQDEVTIDLAELGVPANVWKEEP